MCICDGGVQFTQALYASRFSKVVRWVDQVRGVSQFPIWVLFVLNTYSIILITYEKPSLNQTVLSRTLIVNSKYAPSIGKCVLI